MLDPSKRMQNHPLVYLDNAATTFKPRCVVEAMDDYYNNFVRMHIVAIMIWRTWWIPAMKKRVKH